MKYVIITSIMLLCFFAMGSLSIYIPRGMNPTWGLIWVIPCAVGLLAGLGFAFWLQGGRF
jgi:hypothetical protein